MRTLAGQPGIGAVVLLALGLGLSVTPAHAAQRLRLERPPSPRQERREARQAMRQHVGHAVRAAVQTLPPDATRRERRQLARETGQGVLSATLHTTPKGHGLRRVIRYAGERAIRKESRRASVGRGGNPVSANLVICITGSCDASGDTTPPWDRNGIGPDRGGGGGTPYEETWTKHQLEKVIPGYVRGELKRKANDWIQEELPKLLEDPSLPQSGKARTRAIKQAIRLYLKGEFKQEVFPSIKGTYRLFGGNPKELRKIGQEAIAKGVQRIGTIAKRLERGLPAEPAKKGGGRWWGRPFDSGDYAALPEGAGGGAQWEAAGASDGRYDAGQAVSRVTAGNYATPKEYRKALRQEAKVIRQQDRSHPGEGPPINRKEPYLKGYSQGLRTGIAGAVRQFKLLNPQGVQSPAAAATPKADAEAAVAAARDQLGFTDDSYRHGIGNFATQGEWKNFDATRALARRILREKARAAGYDPRAGRPALRRALKTFEPNYLPPGSSGPKCRVSPGC